MKKLRPALEAEVIGEFLRTEFHHRDYDRDRERWAALVDSRNWTDQVANTLRRALFYRRRGHMWNQIPRETAWWLVQLEDADLERLYVFPRTHWRKIGGNRFALPHVIEQIRRRDFHGVKVVGGTAHGGIEISDVGKIADSVRRLSEHLQNHDDTSAVVLIGIDDAHPVGILEGNHRLTAALLASPKVLKSRFRVYLGLSPAMGCCCWYRTNLTNLARYAANRLKRLGSPDADIERVAAALSSSHFPQPAGAATALPQSGNPR